METGQPQPAAGKMTVRQRVEAVIKGERPDRLPFIDRMELWHRRCLILDAPPAEFGDGDLNRIHSRVGLGRQKFCMPFVLRLKGVELTVVHNGAVIRRESEPLHQEFPALNAPDFVPRDSPGETEIIFSTPKGRVDISYTVSRSMVALGGVEPYLNRHLIKHEADFATAEYILDRAEIVPLFDRLANDRAKVGNNGFVVSRVHRIPFQQVLLEYMGEIPLFKAYYRARSRIDRLVEVLDGQLEEMLDLYRDIEAPIVQFPDNLDGVMTNPRLFTEYCLPHYQKYADILHSQGKLMCSHTDGNLKPLLDLLAESGLDIAEAFSPAPLTACTFDQAWDKWTTAGGPMIWGGIPSPILEATTPEAEFRTFVDRFLAKVAGGRIIVGIGDQVMPESIIDRVSYISRRIEDLKP